MARSLEMNFIREILKFINYESIYKEKFALKGGTVIKKLQAKKLEVFLINLFLCFNIIKY